MSEPNQNDINANENQVLDDSIFDKPQEAVEEVSETINVAENAQSTEVPQADAQTAAPEANWQGNAYGQPAYQVPSPNTQYGYAAPAPGYSPAPAGAGAPKSKVAAGVLGILLGGLGVHKFYLGYTVPGLIMLLVTVLTLGFAGFIVAVIGLVEGIMYLTMSDADFYNTYVVGKKEWF